ncbi:hypothetical protein AFCDBAGC_2418 [Methylobacterium cerastii]|uniref:DUF1993 domain-containing protein n=1 Tax=Methylobacterium cerastii TaxID=932741 RepID=A0ABQ4QH20_9HYPH|nr:MULTISPECIES: DUF1993 domain-containing protein [Methylobacterium]TXN07367.1 DUF1993 domain-containing protein [Methylobacterium sp. WL122]TXN82307.1 DUF1993 domain-containing protein [Methylobacterium sp. WL8]GJD44551.1 hypothetical protein AFCDBAGC_2418 [Methylobacterium cerastii]
MNTSIHDVSAPIFVNALRNMSAWLDKAASEKPEADLLLARLAPDMKPLPAQFQMASDSAKNAMARLAGIEAPAMPDVEASFAELKQRCARTIAFVEGIEPATLASAAEREVELKFPNGSGYRFTGQTYLTGFALPNFFFHVTTAYAILRGAGVSLGKPDFLQHLGPPNIQAAK